MFDVCSASQAAVFGARERQARPLLWEMHRSNKVPSEILLIIFEGLFSVSFHSVEVRSVIVANVESVYRDKGSQLSEENHPG